jgi:hypothetical protein
MNFYRTYIARFSGARGSASVEYVGLALVVSMMMASVANAVNSGLGERVVKEILDRLLAS